MSPLSRAVAIAAAGLALLSPNALASTWEAPVTVAPAAASGTTASWTPVVAVDATGKLTAVWSGDGASGFGIYTATRTASLTKAWSTPVRLSAALTPTALRLAVNASGQAIVGWVDTFPNGTQRVVTVSRSAAGAWSTPLAIATTPSTTIPSTFLGQELVLDAAGRATGLWFASDDALFGSINQPPNGSPTLDAIAPATNTNADQNRPFDLAIDGSGNATALYIGANGLSVLSSTRANGGAWQTPQTVEQWGPTNDANELLAEPRLAINASGQATAVWRRTQDVAIETPGFGIQGATRAAGGRWTTPTTLEPVDDRLITSLDAGIDSAGKTTVAWDLSYVKFDDLLFGQIWTEVRSRTASPAGVWSSIDYPGTRQEVSILPTQTLMPAGLAFYSGVTVAVGSSGQAAVTWATSKPNAKPATTTLQAAVRRAGATWEPSVSLAPLTPIDDAPDSDRALLSSIVVDDAGRGTVVWVDGRSVFSRSTALATLPVDPDPVDPTPTTPQPTTPEPTKPEPTKPDPFTPAPATPSPSNPQPSGQTPPAAAPTKPLATSTSKLVIAMYIVPTGKKCPALANGTVAGVRTPLKVKAAKIRGKLRCKVTGTIVLKTATKVGTKVDVLVTAKGVKRKAIQVAATA